MHSWDTNNSAKYLLLFLRSCQGGGVFTSAIHILLVTPIIFLMQKEYELKKYGKIDVLDAAH